uniref:Uncharacterized protein n=1 Tax=Moniliophthora roreri TaxID=221103 RepID=A0A0W0GAE1_MONRR
MGRWSQYDELEYHVPGVGKIIGYDADTGITYYSGGYRSLPWQQSVVVPNRPERKALPEITFSDEEDDDPNDILALDVHPFTESQPRSGPSTGKKKSITVQTTTSQSSASQDDDDDDIPSSPSTLEADDGSLCIISSSSTVRAETEFSTTPSVGPKSSKPPPIRSKTMHLPRPPPPPYSKLDPMPRSPWLRSGDGPHHSQGAPPRRRTPPSQAPNGTSSQLQSNNNNSSESKGATIKRALTLPPLRLPGSTLDLVLHYTYDRSGHLL